MPGTRQVLLVEDHTQLREALGEAITPLGLEPLHAGSGREAMAKLSNTVPELVCVDVCLPESSGYDLLEHIRSDARLSNVPVIMMTGRRLPNEIALAEEAGADLFLLKPFTSAAFQSSVQRLLLRRRPEGMTL